MIIDNSLVLDLLRLIEQWERKGRCLEADMERAMYGSGKTYMADIGHSPATYSSNAGELARVLAKYYVRQNIPSIKYPRSLCGAIKREYQMNEMSY